MLNDFKEHSGLEVNTTKTEAMWLGEWKDRTDEPFGFKWPKEPINALGVFFSYDQASANRLNFGEKILNLEKTLNTWQQRNLTLYGKINIVKTLGISKLIYSALLLPVPDHYIQEINKLIFNFIWQGTRLKTKETPELENWKAYLKSPIQNVKYHTTVNPLTTSSIYSSLLKTIFVRPTAENNILRHGFKESTIQKVYLMPFSVTNEVKIMFQFKVIPNVLPIRATLYPDGISESPICNLCNA